MKQLQTYLPGLLVTFVLALVAFVLGTWFPLIGGPVFAILLGMLVAPWHKDRSKTKAGIAFTSKKVLQYAVVLLGFGLNLGQVLSVGATSLPIILSTISTDLIVAYIFKNILKVDGNTATLVGVGSSICGGSAIAATAPVIGAKEDEVSKAISVIFLFNILAALIFPTLGDFLHLSNEGFALFAGTAVNDTSSVTATATAWDAIHHANALNGATIVKLTRTLAIIPITLGLSFYQAYRTSKAGGPAQHTFSLKRAFPMFILYFLLASIVTTVLTGSGVDPHLFDGLKWLSRFFIVMAMGAIGLNTDVIKLVKTGGKALALGGICWIAITLVSLGMQALLGIL